MNAEERLREIYTERHGEVYTALCGAKAYSTGAFPRIDIAPEDIDLIADLVVERLGQVKKDE